jgi:RNA 2',3'-cyclic 3'-phosphodiesterase
MRLFFALWPPDAVRAQLSSWSRELRASCHGRPTPRQNLHLTLAFLGAVEDFAAVERAAAEASPRAATLLLDLPGFWKSNHIVWAGASAPPAEFIGLVHDLRAALSRHGVRFDPKPFATHVTLLRDAREPRTVPKLAPIRWDVDGFVLVRSQPQPKGSRYEIAGSWKAAGP